MKTIWDSGNDGTKKYPRVYYRENLLASRRTIIERFNVGGGRLPRRASLMVQ